MHVFGFFISLLLASLTSTTEAKKKYNKANDAVLLSNVRSLTLQKDKLTTGRRSDPVQQLTCAGGNAKGRYDVDVMRCKNSGSEYDPEDIQWTCQATLPPEFKLGSTEVICEGYDSPEDQHVLKGSCGVEYRLVLTDLGEEKYGMQKRYESGDGGGMSDVWKILFWAIFIVLLIIIVVVILVIVFGAFGAGGRVLEGAGRGGGGGGGGGNDDPPPPYTPRAPPPRPAKRGPSYRASTSNANSGPGFWSGAGLGGAAGYAAGNYMGRSSERSRQQQQQQNTYAAPGPSNYGGRSSWFGGGGGSGSGTGSSGGAGPSTSSSSSSSAPSSSRYESTGFGGTRRR